MNYVRIHIEIESPEQMSYENIKYNLIKKKFSNRHAHKKIMCNIVTDHYSAINAASKVPLMRLPNQRL